MSGVQIDVVRVPRLNDAPSDYRRLFEIVESTLTSPAHVVTFNFADCSFLRHNGVAVLGGLARLCEHRGKKVVFDWSSVRGPVKMNLDQNGFAWMFGGMNGPWQGNSIPYREDKVIAPQAIIDYLDAAWLRRDWVRLSPALSNTIRGRVWEIFQNAFDHSQSDIGVVCCGQHYPKRKEVSLCVVDMGRGIPSNVQAHRKVRLSGRESLRWAFGAGNSTAAALSGFPRGVGLGVLESFVRVNGGNLDIYSGTGHASVTREGTRFAELPRPFTGTLVDIRLQCDEKRYVLASEIPRGPLF